MLLVILLILKIIGILLLAVLGLFLLAVLIILFDPVSYRVRAEHGHELFTLEGKVGWLFQLVRARVSHTDGGFHIFVKVLWFTIYDNLQPRKPKAGKLKKEAEQVRTKKNAKAGKKPLKAKPLKTGKNEMSQLDITDEKRDTINEKELISDKKAVLVEKETGNDTGTEAKPGTETRAEAETVWEMEPDLEGSQEEEKGSVFKRIHMKIKEIKERVIAFIRNFIEKIKAILESVHNIKGKLDLILDFIRLEINKEGFQVTFKSLKKILKHMLPKELRSTIRFGTGDPCSTGQALGAMGILYSIYGDKIQVTPDFEEKVLEGRHYARGRIRLITILIIVIKLLLDKRFKQLTKNIVILKEAL
ncbi:MAG TPA: DUF2953 domain-containing protein [Clostridiales bacterium]|nr:DUF2953 domain-containing protein [Clostridiales bacterium]